MAQISLSLLDSMSLVRNPGFCICANKDADQLRGNREADQCLCFRYTDSTIPLLPKFKRHGGLVVERRTPEREVGGSILTQVAMFYP